MTKKLKYEIPDQDTKDGVYAATRAALSLIPVFGGTAVEIFQYIVTPSIEKRRNEWMEDVGQAIRKLENEKQLDFTQLQTNDVFIDTLLQASQIALRNSQDEKLRSLKNAVINSALPEPIDQTFQQMFLNWVDDFTVWHIMVLQLFHNPQKYVSEKNINLDSMNGLDNLLEKCFPELSNDRPLYDQIWQDLLQRGLVNTDSLHIMMLGRAIASKRTTDLGDKFLSFISEK